MGHILIIDDDEQVLLTLSEVVQTLGHTARTAGDGKQGLELFERERFDCVITDLAMPDIDGLTVLRRVKSRSPDTGVLVVTGNSTVDCLAASVNMGVDAYVTKPFKIQEMDEQLSRVLATRQSVPGNLPQPQPTPTSAGGGLSDVRIPLPFALAAAAALIVILRLLA